MRAGRVGGWVLALDLIWAAIAFAASFLIRYGWHGVGDARASIIMLSPFFIATCASWALLSGSLALDGFHGGWRLPAAVSRVVTALLCTMCVLLALAYLGRTYVSRLALLDFGLLLLIGFIAIRWAAYRVMRSRSQKSGGWRVVVVGNGRLGYEIVDKFQRHPETLCHVVGMLFPDQGCAEEMEGGRTISQCVSLGPLGAADYLRQQNIDEVIFALPYSENPEVRNLVARCREYGIRISVVPPLYELYLTRPHLLDLDGLPVLQLRELRANRVYVVGKRALDVAGAVLCSIPAGVVLAPAMLYLWMRRRSAIKAEPRCGWQSRPFAMLRLNVDREPANMSGVERFLESSGITELPQLWNVFRGDMSLVGPRPESPSRVQNYSEWQTRRLSALPGITGLAQVNGVREHNSSEEKARHDLQYLMHRSLLLDLSILLQTLWVLGKRLLGKPFLHRTVTADSARAESISLRKKVVSSAHRSQPSEN